MEPVFINYSFVVVSPDDSQFICLVKATKLAEAIFAVRVQYPEAALIL
jgi:hypothetical protein